jgi:hypothetical protein
MMPTSEKKITKIKTQKEMMPLWLIKPKMSSRSLISKKIVIAAAV